VSSGVRVRHWQLDELSSARRGRWQLGTQQYQVLTTT